jgi:hypothetical protein
MKNVTIIVSALLTILAAGSCAGNRWGRMSRLTLSQPDSVFIDRTLEVYDAFVRSKMGDELPIGEAYKRFFAENAAKLESAGDLSIFMPDSTFVYGWTSDFIGGRLQNFLVEPVYISPPELEESRFPQWYGGWRMNINPGGRTWLSGIVAMGWNVAKINPVWKKWTDSTEAAGDIFVPMTVGISEKINFDNKHERFLAVISFMNGCFYHRDFNLVKDARRNDSLKIAWELE